MSRVLIASITSRIPALANSGAAWRRFSTKVLRTSAAGASLGGMPARQLTRLQPSAVAYSMALIDAGAELLLAARQAGDAALAAGPVAGRHVVQRLGQAVLLEQVGQELLLVGVGEQVLDRLEAVGRGRGEALDEVVLVVEHGQIGRELRHRRPPSCGGAASLTPAVLNFAASCSEPRARMPTSAPTAVNRQPSSMQRRASVSSPVRMPGRLAARLDPADRRPRSPSAPPDALDRRDSRARPTGRPGR